MDTFAVIEAYDRAHGIVNHQIESYNHFIHEGIFNVINSNPTIMIGNRFRFTLIPQTLTVHPPTFTELSGDDGEHVVYPMECVHRQITYAANLSCDIEVSIDGEITVYHDVVIGMVPVMVKSDACNLYKLAEDELVKHGECTYDRGGYFIVKGTRMCATLPESPKYNHIFIYHNRRQVPHFPVYIETRSIYRDRIVSTQIGWMDGKFSVIIPYVSNHVPLGTIFKALGVTSEEKILRLINSKDPKLIRTLEITYGQTQDEALLIIGQRKLGKNTDAIFNARKLLTNEFLPHQGTNLQKKAFYIGFMTKTLLQYLKKLEADDKPYTVTDDSNVPSIAAKDRDHYANKRVSTVGIVLYQQFSRAYKRMLKEVRTNTEKLIQRKNVKPHLISFVKKPTITNSLLSCLSSENRSQGNTPSVAQIYEQFNYPEGMAQLRKIVTPMSDNGVVIAPRNLHGSHWGVICLFETPEGKKVGLAKNPALTCHITLGVPSELVKMIVKPFLETIDTSNKKAKVFVDGDWVGMTPQPEEVTKTLRELRRAGDLSYEVSITNYGDVIIIQSDPGRVMRPLLIIEDGELLLTETDIEELKSGKKSWKDLRGKVEFLDKQEEDVDTLIVCFPSEIQNHPHRDKLTHCELHPSMIMGVSANLIPLPDHSQSPRNTYQSAMGKQAIGIPYLNYRTMMTGTTHILDYPQKPLVMSKAAKILKYDEMPSGCNAIVAICPFSGFGQEDSLVFNKSSVERGLFSVSSFLSYRCEIRPEKGQEVTIPDKDKVSCCRGNPSKLGADGIIEPGTRVEKGDILIGIISKTSETDIIQNCEFTDRSIIYEDDLPGQVDKVQINTNANFYTLIRVTVVQRRVPEIGDKFSSREGQKGTIGMMFNQEDLPFTSQGMVPDLIINSLAFPSRMTIAQLIESLSGKRIAGDLNKISMKEINESGTPFSNFNLNKIRDDLHKAGFAGTGGERMIDGMTGNLLDTLIFIGPVYYQRLRHMVVDKIHARARGPKAAIARQPKEGRSAQGGFRVGQMERDCMHAQGCQRVVIDRMLEQSDQFFTKVCKNCGMIAIYSPEDGSFGWSECTLCRGNQLEKVSLPYGMKLLTQEMMGMNIVTQMFVDE